MHTRGGSDVLRDLIIDLFDGTFIPIIADRSLQARREWARSRR